MKSGWASLLRDEVVLDGILQFRDQLALFLGEEDVVVSEGSRSDRSDDAPRARGIVVG